MSAGKDGMKLITQQQIMALLDACYQKAVDGLGKVSPPIEEFAQSYTDKSADISSAARSMLKNQIIKCTASGFITGFGGLITLPVTIPANIGSVLYVQMRMIACTACLAGYDTDSDQVQTLVYACLAGVAVNGVVKKAGAALGEKVAVNLIKKIPGEALSKINKAVGFRFLTKFGEKGLINMGKLIPAVGAIVTGGFDLVETKIIANRAYKWFIEGDYSVDSNSGCEFSQGDVIDADTIEQQIFNP